MSRNKAPSIPASLANAKLKVSGLSEAQQAACDSALRAFLKRNALTSWELSVNLTHDDGPQGQQLHISAVASPELDFEVRSSELTVDKSVDLAEVVDLFLETHYNACMNRKAMSSPKPPAARLATVGHRTR